MVRARPGQAGAGHHAPNGQALGIILKLYSIAAGLVTAYDTPQTREHARKAGSFSLVVKPFDNRMLLRAIREALGPPANNGNREDRKGSA